MSEIIIELESQLKKATNQQVKIDLLNEIAWELRLDDPVKARLLSEQASELAINHKFVTDLICPVWQVVFAILHS